MATDVTVTRVFVNDDYFKNTGSFYPFTGPGGSGGGITSRMNWVGSTPGAVGTFTSADTITANATLIYDTYLALNKLTVGAGVGGILGLGNAGSYTYDLWADASAMYIGYNSTLMATLTTSLFRIHDPVRIDWLNGTGERVVTADASGNLQAATDLDSVIGANLTTLGTIGTGTWQGTPIADAYVDNDITLTNITQITNRSHTNLSDIGTNTHGQIDAHIGSTSNPHSVDATDIGTFGSAVAGVVPASGGGTTNFLRADGTWAAAGGSGMVYPGAGIPLSTGSAWGTSITNNSANWNTAYGWGDHAGLYDALGAAAAVTPTTLGLVIGTDVLAQRTFNDTNWDTAYGWGDHDGLYDTVGTASGLISTHQSTYNHTNYNTAYSHSQVVTGNPHSVEWTELDGARSSISLSGFNDDLSYNNYTHPNHSGQVTSTGDGAQVLAVSAITGQAATTTITGTDEFLINDGGALRRVDVNYLIAGQATALTSGLASTDELLVSDAGTIKRMDVSVLQTYMQNNLTFGGASLWTDNTTYISPPNAYSVRTEGDGHGFFVDHTTRTGIEGASNAYLNAYASGTLAASFRAAGTYFYNDLISYSASHSYITLAGSNNNTVRTSNSTVSGDLNICTGNASVTSSGNLYLYTGTAGTTKGSVYLGTGSAVSLSEDTAPTHLVGIDTSTGLLNYTAITDIIGSPMQVVKKTLAFADVGVTQNIIDLLPGDVAWWDARIHVETAFNGTAPSFKIGNSGHNTTYYYNSSTGITSTGWKVLSLSNDPDEITDSAGETITCEWANTFGDTTQGLLHLYLFYTTH